MKWLIIAVVAICLLLAAMIVAPEVIGDKGYVLIAMGTLTIEMTVVSLCISLIVAAVLLYILRYVFSRIWSLFRGSHHWFGSWGKRKRQKAFYRGFQALAEGELEEAKGAFRKTTDGDFDGVNYLAAAQVARHLGEKERMRTLLEQAGEYRDSTLAAQLVLARLDLEEGRDESALKRLEELEPKHAKHKQVIRLKTEAMARLGHWQELQDQLPHWKYVLKDDYVVWAQRIAKGKFAEIASKHGAVELKSHWENLPRKLRNDDAYRCAYVRQLLEQGMHQDAQTCLVNWQRKGPNEFLFPLMKELYLPNPASSIKLLEEWIKQDDTNATYYSTLGHIAYNAGEDVLAEKALLRSVKLAENKEDLLMLAKISERREDNLQALSLYKKGFAVDEA
ncbi:heme biosynthesis HemY N-terminal domain-containing protein [Alteromonas sp. ASW11-130]|uniref:heme biosynthesis HemY N-terminal domain-containing protein n=1 Tax=Alteromonas sp. ASW11-130 TaxID=3015775 RepID=UPI0022425E6C|nr:heme biosynthesis HemY N-terminal domain-containing protein [Alteromonas sp. ASW11-130]MCW8091114.1 heme biosynthesis protein [Alteromonas sp. ASW11-130]